MGFDLLRRKCPAHNRILKVREACPECVDLARKRVRDEYKGEFSRDHERGSYSGPAFWAPLPWSWKPMGLHPDSCPHKRSTAWGSCADCGASAFQKACDRLNAALGYRP